MATEKYSVDTGGNYSTVTKATGSSTTKAMEMTVDLAKFTTKQEVLNCAQALVEYITRDIWKPA